MAIWLVANATARAETAAAAPAPAAAPAAAAPSSSGGPPAPADSSAPAAAGGADSGAYTVKLRSLEKNVNELKEQIFRTKARLNLLKETVLGGSIGASRAIIHHKNEMGSSFRLVKAAYALDGVQIYSKSDDTGALADMQDFDVYNGAIQPGSHTLSVALTYQGNGFGVFSYLKGYKFNVKSSHTFVAGDSKTTNITVVGYEKGNITTQLSDKPAVDFRVNVIAAGEGGATAAATTPAKK
ncbi:MAG TPA: dihydrolipoamide acetyltransferase [Polyangia bacterium]|nr:dihydrolipoamide acetyltransferase [Polyangia bacterium]